MVARRLYCLFILLACCLMLHAQVPCASNIKDSVYTVPGCEYKRNPVFEIFFGKHYRDVWESPVRVPVYDPAKEGLKPVKIGGRYETKTLHLIDTAGNEYVARSVDKDLSQVLSPWLRRTFAGTLFKDQVSANEPFAALVVAPLAQAAGVPHVSPHLCMLSIDSAGGFGEFDHMLVLLEERPGAQWAKHHANVQKVASTSEMMHDRLGEEHCSIDARTYLRARLLDLLIGDWSRHEDQYRWIAMQSGNSCVYKPMPRDRDHAFYRNDGLMNRLSLLVFPPSQSFGKKIKHIESLTYMGRKLDRLILSQLSWDEWKSITDNVAAAVTDSVIDEAVKQLPAGANAKDGAFIASALKQRRDQLQYASKRFYEMMSRDVYVFGSAGNEVYSLERDEKGRVTLTVQVAGEQGMLYKRTFASTVRSIRIYALDGNDQLKVNNQSSKGPLVTFYGGGGENSVHGIHKKRKLRFYNVKPQDLLEYYTEGSRLASKRAK